MLDSKIEAVRLHFGIVNLADWQSVEPGWITKVDGVGPKTLELIRVFLAGHDMTLKNDMTPAFWKKYGAAARIGGQSISDEDICEVTPFTVAIDTREQHPWTFQGYASDTRYQTIDGELKRRPLIVQIQQATLDSGDYSVIGLESRIGGERKSKADLYATLGSGRERFERELARLNAMDCGFVVIEAGWNSIVYQPPPHSKMSGKSIYRSIIAYSQRFPRVHWWPMPDRAFAERHTFRLLQRFWLDEQKKENPRHG